MNDDDYNNNNSSLLQNFCLMLNWRGTKPKSGVLDTPCSSLEPPLLPLPMMGAECRRCELHRDVSLFWMSVSSNLNTCSLSHIVSTLKIWSKSSDKFLNYLVNRPTQRYTYSKVRIIISVININISATEALRSGAGRRGGGAETASSVIS